MVRMLVLVQEAVALQGVDLGKRSMDASRIAAKKNAGLMPQWVG